jgi:RNA polymerase-binding transcription factor DksA
MSELRPRLDSRRESLLRDAQLIVEQPEAAAGRLREVPAAIVRLDEETYGQCRESGHSVPLARLRLMPSVRYCSASQLVVRAGRVD